MTIRQMTMTVLIAVAALLAAACGGDDDDGLEAGDDPGNTEPGTVSDEVAWARLGHVEDTLPGNLAAAAVENADALRSAWADHGFAGDVPEVDFDTHVVLLLGQPDDACVDELVGLDVVDGALQVEWLPPAGACNEPLIFRLHAVSVHRGHLPSEFTVTIPEPFTDDLEPATIELPPFDGDAPATPEPPQAMSDAEVDAVFDGHPVARCTDEAFPWRAPNPVDGPLSDDPEVAAAQQARADFGVASDEATVAALVADPPDAGIEDLGFPLTPEEWDLDRSVSETMDRVSTWLNDSSWVQGEDYTGLIDRSDGIRPAVIVGEADAAAMQADLDAEFGAGTVTVHTTPYEPDEVSAAQDAVSGIVDDMPEPSRIVGISGPPGPAAISLVDPTPEALDAIAAAVDPSLVCVEVQRSGVVTGDGDGG